MSLFTPSSILSTVDNSPRFPNRQSWHLAAYTIGAGPHWPPSSLANWDRRLPLLVRDLAVPWYTRWREILTLNGEIGYAAHWHAGDSPCAEV
jgi:hypothetical protein